MHGDYRKRFSEEQVHASCPFELESHVCDEDILLYRGVSQDYCVDAFEYGRFSSQHVLHLFNISNSERTLPARGKCKQAEPKNTGLSAEPHNPDEGFLSLVYEPQRFHLISEGLLPLECLNKGGYN